MDRLGLNWSATSTHISAASTFLPNECAPGPRKVRGDAVNHFGKSVPDSRAVVSLLVLSSHCFEISTLAHNQSQSRQVSSYLSLDLPDLIVPHVALTGRSTYPTVMPGCA